MLKSLSSIALLWAFSCLFANGAGLSGTYTIDPSSAASSTNYTSFRDAIMDLNSGKRASGTANGPGVSGSVIFDVSDGTYNECLRIRYIKGTSKANNIVFRSKSGDSSKVIIDSTALQLTATPSPVLLLDSCSFIDFKQITINNSTVYTKKSTYSATVVELYRKPHDISFESCVMNSPFDRLNAGIVFYAPPLKFTDLYKKLTIKYCRLHGGNSGIYAYNGMNFYIYHNLIDSFNATGICNHGGSDSFDIIKNVIVANPAGPATSPTTPCGLQLIGIKHGNVFNNMVVDLYSQAHGISCGVAMKVCYNTVVTQSGGTFYATIYNYSGGMLINNNIFQNIGGGLAIYANGNITTKPVPDYNDVYTTGTYIGTISTSSSVTNYTTLAKFAAASVFEKHSISANPYLSNTSIGDLHLTSSSFALLGKGIPVVGITDDIDGQTRAAKPDLGADETLKFNTDAGVASIDSPGIGFCTANQTIYAKVMNFGSDTLKNAEIHWKIGGSSMPTVSWSGALAINKSIIVKLDTFSFSKNPGLVKVWTENPNGKTDSNATNDTAKRWVAMGMVGTYNIDTGIAIHSFREAANDLAKFGICGPVIFDAADGTYNESVRVKAVNGSSPTNTITFESKSHGYKYVTLDTSWQGTKGVQASTFCLDSTCYVTIKQLTLSNSTTWKGYNNVIALWNGASHTTIQDCYISEYPWLLVKNPLKSSEASGICNDPNHSESFTLVKNNIIVNGTDGIRFSALTSEKGNIAIGNTITNTKYEGIYMDYQDSAVIAKNQILMKNCDASRGIDVSNFLNNDTSYITNNFVSLSGENSSGLSSVDNGLINIYYNSILAGATTTGLNAYWSAYIFATKSCKANVFNNIFMNDSGGVAIHTNSLAINNSDYNDYYVTKLSSYLGCYGATAPGSYKSKLSTWISATGQDKHSISANPKFDYLYTGDLHITDTTSPVYRKGTSLVGKYDDIDGEMRHTNPDMGADENNPLDTNDVGITSIISPLNNSCGKDSTQVQIKLKNFAVMDQTNTFTMKVEISGAGSSTMTGFYVATLPAGHDTIITFNFSTLDTRKGGLYQVKAYTMLSGDQNILNDTSLAKINIAGLPNSGFTKSTLTTASMVSFKATDSTLSKYDWNFGDSTTHGSGFNPTHTYLKNGLYTTSLLATNSNGCKSSSSDSIRILITDIEFQNNNTNISIYPNPIHALLTLELKQNTERGEVFVIDMTGKVVKDMTYFKNMSYLNIDLSTLPSGMYFLHYQSQDKVWNGKFVKE